MELKEIEIINFKGITNKKIKLIKDISFLVSENNVGKTRVLESIKAFYDKTKGVNIRLSFEVNNDEKEILKRELSDNGLSNVFSVELKSDGKHYYGETPLGIKISKDKILGSYIYIPSVNSHEDNSNPAKPNVLRELFHEVFDSGGFSTHLDEFNINFKTFYDQFTENSQEQISRINNSITIGGFSVNISKKEITSDVLIKNNFELKIKENNQLKDFAELGTGIQRNIINAILCTKKNSKFIIYLYDEPETFLSPTAQKNLIENLYSNNQRSQFIVATHSPHCIIRKINILDSIIRLKKESNDNICLFQYDDEKFKSAIRSFNEYYTSDGTSGGDKLLEPNSNKSIIKFWESKRVNALFEKKILLCEGPTEELFVDMVISSKNPSIPYVNALGKFKIPYYLILFDKIFGIETYVLFDKDNEHDPVHAKYNSWIQNNTSNYLKLNNSMEEELGYSVSGNGDDKLNIFLDKHLMGEIVEKEELLKNKILNFWNGE